MTNFSGVSRAAAFADTSAHASKQIELMEQITKLADRKHIKYVNRTYQIYALTAAVIPLHLWRDFILTCAAGVSTYICGGDNYLHERQK